MRLAGSQALHCRKLRRHRAAQAAVNVAIPHLRGKQSLRNAIFRMSKAMSTRAFA
jgi:hypothetical protein